MARKQDEHLNWLLFGPEDEQAAFQLDLKMHMARIKSAASFLDNANMAHLRRPGTAAAVASAAVNLQRAVNKFRTTTN